MKVVYIAGPFAGDEKANTDQACRLGRLALLQGFSPIVPHAGILLGAYGDDRIEQEREKGMAATLQILRMVAATGGELWVFGSSSGTDLEIAEWKKIAGTEGLRMWTDKN